MQGHSPSAASGSESSHTVATAERTQAHPRAVEPPALATLTARAPERLEHTARELGAAGTAAFDVTDAQRLERCFGEPAPSRQAG
jgi:hypothetical protein